MGLGVKLRREHLITGYGRSMEIVTVKERWDPVREGEGSAEALCWHPTA